MYGITTDETLSHELLNTYQGWDNYVAHLWYCFFNYCELKPDDTVVEVGPGSSIKIALALKKMDFHGELYIVEPFDEALQLIESQYKKHLPHATIHPIKKTLSQSLADLPQQPTFLVAHHVLDDMIMASDLANENLSSLFSWIKGDELKVKQNFSEHWQALQANSKQLDRIKSNILKQWQDIFSALSPKVAIMSQYPSLVLNDHGMSELNSAGQELLSNIKMDLSHCLENKNNVQTLLNANKNYNFPLIGNEVLNAKNWLLAFPGRKNNND